MKILSCLAAVFLVVTVVDALPTVFHYLDNGVLVRTRRSPHRSMMFSGYYGQPAIDQRNGYAIDSGMAAYAGGDSVATGSYLGQRAETDCKSCGGGYNIVPVEESNINVEVTTQVVQDYPVQFPVGAPVEESVAVAKPEIPEVEEPVTQKVPKSKAPRRKQKPQVDESDEDDSGDWFIPKFGRGTRPSFNFFPMMFGGGSGYGRSGNEGGGPGGATAIANSFSTGKGGVATSHATAYGEPSDTFRNSWKRRSPSQE